MKERQRLVVDLEALFPREEMKIGNDTIQLYPLNIKQLAVVMKKVNEFVELLQKKNITLENWGSSENILEITSVLLDKFPDILEEASNIAIEDLERLPIDIVVSIVIKVIEINLQAKESLEGNLESLTKIFQKMTKNA